MSDRPVRILFLDQYGGMGGGQRVLLSLVKAADGFAVTVLAPRNGKLQEALAREVPGAEHLHCDEPLLRHGRKGAADLLHVLLYAWNFRRHLPLLRSQDIIHVNGLRHLPGLMVWSMLGCLGPHARVIWHVHLDHSGMEKCLIWLAARLPGTARILANSQFVMDRLGFTSDKIVLVENALDESFAGLPFTDRFTDATSASAAVVGTLRPEKGQDIAVAATPGTMALHLIGPDGDGAGEWIASLKARTAANVSFDGPVQNITMALAVLGIQYNLVPSRWDEPFGLAAIEGMACSCLTIVSGRGGLAGIAAATGALVARDAEELSRCLERLEGMTTTQRCQLAREQHEATLSRYAPSRFRLQIRSLFDDVFRTFSA